MSRARWWSFQHRIAPYVFVAPFVVLFFIFTLYPIVRSFSLSLHKTIGPRHEIFVGLDNYRFLLRDWYFWLAMLNSIAFMLAFITLQIPLALGLAVLLNSKRVRFRGVFRFAFFSTHLTGHVFVAVIFAQLLAPRNGLLNRTLSVIWRSPVEIGWLSDPILARISILIAALWLSVGYAMIYFLAALQSVDPETYEAAVVDGAGRWSRFWHVTLPGIRPVMTYMILVGMIGSLQLFELPWVLFQQTVGPNQAGLMIVTHLYQTGFNINDFGMASAVGWMLVAVIAVLSLAQIRLTRLSRETNE